MRSLTANICRTLVKLQARRVHTQKAIGVETPSNVSTGTQRLLLRQSVSPRIDPVFKFHPTRPSNRPPDNGEEVDDAEWDLRVGRGLYVLTSTLPEFFNSGLILNASHDAQSGDDEPIYSKLVELSYTPPIPLPPPFPQTFHIQGLPLYQGSAVLLRSSFTTLYTDCSVSLERMQIVPGGVRERNVKIDLTMLGKSRLTSTNAEWNVLSTYSFSPLSGKIYRHQIESIYPAPHSAVFDAMRDSLLRLMGIKRSEDGVGELDGKIGEVSRTTECPFPCRSSHS
ncbi:hypothetical protein BS47DRAFT_1295850 [Hydnum rufescens UP504]|uniref:Uncharacterized protein n=1 Tax=Hydnum rufescens UP504 TaxID=1448309 RepID=A0A9P6DSZ6_9AGAM|nr:hypothetical protein BS47DRAFT_1295850 [Hydnum rufescens UP504]